MQDPVDEVLGVRVGDLLGVRVALPVGVFVSLHVRESERLGLGVCDAEDVALRVWVLLEAEALLVPVWDAVHVALVVLTFEHDPVPLSDGEADGVRVKVEGENVGERVSDGDEGVRVPDTVIEPDRVPDLEPEAVTERDRGENVNVGEKLAVTDA